MRLPDKTFIGKLLIWLFATALIIAAANLIYIYYSNEKSDKEISSKAVVFLNHIKTGNVDSAGDLWPTVYSARRNNPDFLDSFSDSLFTAFNNYYINKYSNEINSSDLYEICRLYNSFLDDDKIAEASSTVLSDYINEKINYDKFVSAMNDLFFFTEYKSSHIPEIIDMGKIIHDSRVIYEKAIGEAESANYALAIELMRSVDVRDLMYYPKAIEKIDEYILLLTEEVKNGY